MPFASVAKLNPEQWRAVEHGVAETALSTAPLLIIAGAGSGKTNTLAHRVAHLIVAGVDPRRILLMTFSRRAAAEMTLRVERICSQALGSTVEIMTDALTWAGTFHAIGARLLREYADQIGLQPNFTIHDRQDSADLMNLVRHELGFSKMESRFPTKSTCLAIYSRAVNAEMELDDVLRNDTIPGAPVGMPSFGNYSRPTSRRSRRKACSITMICCCTGQRRSVIQRWPVISAIGSTTC